jgi:hypothetical protein
VFRFVFRYWEQMWSNLAKRNRQRAILIPTDIDEKARIC